jgi:serine/threonine protein phosphatase PrpC
MKYTLFQDTRTGARAYNQDRLAHAATPESLLLVLADGMGGHAHGEIAAQFAVDSIAGAFRTEAKPRLANPELFLFRAIGHAHTVIVQQSGRLGLADSPRTTVVACVVQEGRAWWSFIGDSRFYLIRDGRIVVRTRDHTPVQVLIDAGRIREEAAAHHPERNKLLQCLGGSIPPRLEPTASERLAKGDLVLLCSDGFWGPLTQRQLLVGLIAKEPARALQELIALAQARAGPLCDNISVLAMQWHEEALPASDAERTLPLDEMATDVRDFSATDPDFLHMTDADIERAIDEIRTALRKHTPPRS